MKLMLYWSLLLVLLACCTEIRKASEIQFQTLDMSFQHLSSTSVCDRTSTNGIKNMESKLEVVDRHGPCAQTNQNRLVNSPSFANILVNDQLRVKSIQARAKPDSVNMSQNPNKLISLDKRAQLPILPLYSGDFIVTFGLGTPKQRLSLSFDTGSYLMWTQCKPCPGSCYRQKDKIFDPRHSCSYSNISCSDIKCSQLGSATSDKPGCSSGTCVYTIEYGDESFTTGFFAKDKLTITPTDVFKDFLFGCGHNNTGLFVEIDGILGLGRYPVSFVSQTATKYYKCFSYCLPPTLNSPGFLAFGKNNKTMISTPLVLPPQGLHDELYFIEISAISVCGKRLPINQEIFTRAGTIIDSGTIITRLPPEAYNKMSVEFKRHMKELNYTSAPAYHILDTCYHICEHMNTNKVPSVSFTFKGDAIIDLDASGILIAINSTYVCLAFTGNNDPSDLAVFGTTQQKKFEVMYDVEGKKLGFARNPKCQ